VIPPSSDKHGSKGLLLIISGPSGVGKGTVCRRLMEIKKNLELSVSTTTRPPRAGEVEGREYNFTAREQFQKLIDKGRFLEWAEVHGQYYGTRLDRVDQALNSGSDLILEIDTQGAEQVRAKIPDAVSIFLAPPSFPELEERIKGRGTEDRERIIGRLKVARKEMEAYCHYNYVVVNDRVDQAAELIAAIIDVEKCRVDRGAKPPGWGGGNR